MKVIFTIGVSASGKSTWAKEQAEQSGGQWVTVERDTARLQVLKTTKPNYDLDYIDWRQWNWKWEKSVTEIVWAKIKEASEKKQNLIISDTNLDGARRALMKEQLKEFGYTEFEEKVFDIEFLEAVKRDTKRASSVGFDVIAKQMTQFHAEFSSQYKGTRNAPKTVLVDIDGTLAEMRDRGPFDWNKVGNDAVKEEVRDVVKGLQLQGYKVVILSGRDGVCYQETLDWLHQKAGLVDFDFFMRKANDMRKDSIIKSEIFWNVVAPKYNVKMVIDDRPQVTRMWRSIGLNVLQVGNPYVEF